MVEVPVPQDVCKFCKENLKELDVLTMSLILR